MRFTTTVGMIRDYDCINGGRFIYIIKNYSIKNQDSTILYGI